MRKLEEIRTRHISQASEWMWSFDYKSKYCECGFFFRPGRPRVKVNLSYFADVKMAKREKEIERGEEKQRHLIPRCRKREAELLLLLQRL